VPQRSKHSERLAAPGVKYPHDFACFATSTGHVDASKRVSGAHLAES
jgi:hypothetical protein